MIHAELISTTKIDDRFHMFSEQLTGVNTASVVQMGKRPKSKLAYVLAYFKAFTDPNGDTSDVRALLGLMSFGMLCAGTDLDMAEVTGHPHGLRCLQSRVGRQGVVGVIFIGNGDEWATAIRNAGFASLPIQEWGQACYRQFAANDLAEYVGTVRPVGGGYLLED